MGIRERGQNDNRNVGVSCDDDGYHVPILLLIFNRVENTRRVFEAIRNVRPAELFIAADGPRTGFKDDAVNCEATRAVVSSIDWPCDVKRLFRDSNLGCGQAVSSAIDWFFDHVQQGVILEDDCLPHPDFFAYCATLLERYSTDSRVRMITGTNFCGSAGRNGHSYFFSRHFSVWGWATWRRAWAEYDVDIRKWGKEVDYAELIKKCGSWRRGLYYGLMFDRVKDGVIDTWDYQWAFHCLVNGGLAVTPASNLISNVGLEGTHSRAQSGLHQREAEGLSGELVEPSDMCPDLEYEHCIAIPVDRMTWSFISLLAVERLFRCVGPLRFAHRILLSIYRNFVRS